MKTLTELRAMDEAELQKELYKSTRELFSLRMAVKTGKDKDNAKIKRVKTYVAQIRTLWREKDLSAA